MSRGGGVFSQPLHHPAANLSHALRRELGISHAVWGLEFRVVGCGFRVLRISYLASTSTTSLEGSM